jgi:Glyoxalase-like domain
MTGIVAIAIDCHDASTLALFWAEALSLPRRRDWQDAHGTKYVQIGPEHGGPDLLFQPVDERKTGKNRLHLDIRPSELTQQGEVERLAVLGARVLSDDPDLPWVLMADPEGNEFCVLPVTANQSE